MRAVLGERGVRSHTAATQRPHQAERLALVALAAILTVSVFLSGLVLGRDSLMLLAAMVGAPLSAWCIERYHGNSLR
jgi:mannitol-specific phosphotransferase system IIBC component